MATTSIPGNRVIRLKSAATAKSALGQLRAGGVPAKLYGSHGGDGLHSQGGNIMGVEVPEAVYTAYKAHAAKGPCSVYDAIQAAIAAWDANGVESP